MDFQQLLYNSDRPETLAFLERLRALLNRYEARVAVGEIGGPDSAERSLGAYLADGRLHTAYSFRFLLQDPPTPANVRDALEEWERVHRRGWPTWVFSNHDAPRAPTRWGGEHAPAAYAQQLNALLLSLRGSICLYQGEELGLPQAHVPFDRLQDPEAIANWPRTLGRDGARTPMPWSADAPHAGFSSVEPWLPIDWRHHALAVDLQHGIPGSTLETTRALLRLRREFAALRTGALRFVQCDDAVLVHERASDAPNDREERRSREGRVLCGFNFAPEDRTCPLPPGAWRVIGGTPERSLALRERVTLPALGWFWATPA